MEPLLLSVHPDVSTALGVSKSTAYELVDAGVLPAVRIGRRKLVPAAAVERYVARLIAEQIAVPASAA